MSEKRDPNRRFHVTVVDYSDESTMGATTAEAWGASVKDALQTIGVKAHKLGKQASDAAFATSGE